MSKFADLLLDPGQLDHGRTDSHGTGNDVLNLFELLARPAAGLGGSRRAFAAPPDYCMHGREGLAGHELEFQIQDTGELDQARNPEIDPHPSRSSRYGSAASRSLR